jgi:hypothetical protein
MKENSSKKYSKKFRSLVNEIHDKFILYIGEKYGFTDESLKIFKDNCDEEFYKFYNENYKIDEEVTILFNQLFTCNEFKGSRI